MIPLSITPNIESNPWPELKDQPFGKITKIGRLPRGTTSGKSTVTLVITLPDGKIVAGETTLVLMQNAITVLTAADQVG